MKQKRVLSKITNPKRLLVFAIVVMSAVGAYYFGTTKNITQNSTTIEGISKVKDTRLLADTADYVNPDLPTVSPKKQYHVIVTADGSLYTEWQLRVCYFWYLRLKSRRPKNMGGFTRILHSGKPDAWMHEIPTVIVDPLPEHLQKIANGYVVLNRPYAILQWVQNYMPKMKEHYVLMAEPDHLFVRAPPLWATRDKPAAYPFWYINPQTPESSAIIKRFNPKNIPIKNFFPIGNSPVMISKEQIEPIVKIWSNISLQIKQDSEADKTWGWVQEMYAWSIASAIVPGGPTMYTLRPEFMVQPPWDADLVGKNGKKTAIIHYTYANDFDAEGTFTPAIIGKWHFDKRDYMEKYPLLRTKKPPPGCTNAATKLLIRCLNIAAKSLPGWIDLAYKHPSEIKPYFGAEGDVLDFGDPDEWFDDDAEYSEFEGLDEIDEYE